MKEEHIKLLICPTCEGAFDLTDAIRDPDESIESGTLRCAVCGKEYPIVKHIPRFVPLENYANGFGLEWTKHARTQYDSYSGASISEDRFFKETKWGRELKGEMILEVGSGSGRFTEQAAKTGAMIISCDYSYSVDANYSSNGKD